MKNFSKERRKGRKGERNTIMLIYVLINIYYFDTRYYLGKLVYIECIKEMVYIPPEIMNLIFSFHNPYWGIKEKMKKLHEYLDKENLKLSRGGIFTKDTKYYFDTDPMKDLTTKDYKNIAKCVNEIPHIFLPRKTLSIGSYNGKHRVEQYRKLHNKKEDNYISNGDFIMAMLLYGHKMRKEKGNGNPNCNFYVSLKNK